MRGRWTSFFSQYKINILTGVQAGAFVVLSIGDAPAPCESVKWYKNKPKLITVEQLELPTSAVSKVKTH